MKAFTIIAAVLLVGGMVGAQQAPVEVTAPKAEPVKPTIDVVFCIDCSGSMGQIIETAKRKIWSIVNEIAKARPVPRLRIGWNLHPHLLRPGRSRQPQRHHNHNHHRRQHPPNHRLRLPNPIKREQPV